MLKIVLIDDEIIVLRGISALLKKQSEYELAGTADNGIDGLKTVLETKPDIVMTDIRMPGMRLGVVDYIEKPVTIPKLKEVLKKASGILSYQQNYREMTQNREKADRAIMERLIRHLYERPQDREEMLRQIGEKNPALTGCRSVFVLKTAEDRGESVDDYRSIVQQLTFDMIGHDPVEVYSFYDRENLILVYFNLGSMEFPFLARVGEQKNRIEAGGLQVMIGVSCVHKSLSDLEKAFEEADNAFRYARYLGETEVVSSSDVEFAGSAGEESKKV